MRAIGAVAALVGVALVSGCFEGRPEAPPRPRRIVDLSPPLNERTIVLQYGRRAAAFFGIETTGQSEPVRPPDPLRTYGFTYFRLLSHGGAHLDAPARLLRDGQRPYEVKLEDLFGWSRMVDMRWHDRTSQITTTDLENFNVKEGEIIILNVGYVPPANDEWPEYAALSPQASRWLADKHIRALVTDMPSISDVSLSARSMDRGGTPEEIWPAHLPLFQSDIPVVEGLIHLDDLLGERRIYFAGFPLPLEDRSGAPMRAVALLYD